MYVPPVGRTSEPSRLRGIEEWIPEQMKEMLPGTPAGLFAVGVAAFLVLATLMSGGVSTGRRRR